MIIRSPRVADLPRLHCRGEAALVARIAALWQMVSAVDPELARQTLGVLVKHEEDRQKAEAELGHAGRVLLRPSGTEPVVRVMVEAREEGQAEAMAAQLAGVVEVALGGG